MPHNWCPPSRRGHSWSEPSDEDLKVPSVAALDRRAIRVCKRCGKLGCVSSQGLIKEIS